MVNMRNWTIKEWGMAGAGVALVAFFAFALIPSAVPIEIGDVTKGEVKVTVRDEGETRVRELYTISAPVAGRVLRIAEKEGDEVRAGRTIVATMLPTDPGFLDVRLREQYQADVRAAESEVAFAASDQKRAAELFRTGVVARARLDQANLALNSAKAKLEAAKARLIVPKGVTKVELRNPLEGPGDAPVKPLIMRTAGGIIELRAPVDGRIFTRHQISEGVIPAGAPILDIGDPGDIEVKGRFLSSDAVKVKAGDPVSIVNWGGPAIPGRVRVVEPKGFLKVSALGIEEQRVLVIIDVDHDLAAKSRLGHDYRVEAEITVGDYQNVIRVPTAAVFRDGDQWAVWRIDGRSASLQHVKLGGMSADFAVVREGLGEGDRVILHPSDRVEDGVRVTDVAE